MADGVTRTRGWDHGWNDDTPKAVVIRCKGRRLAFAPGGEAQGVYTDGIGLSSQMWGDTHADCPNHPAGHEIDEVRMRAYVESVRDTKRAVAVDVSRVEVRP